LGQPSNTHPKQEATSAIFLLGSVFNPEDRDNYVPLKYHVASKLCNIIIKKIVLSTDIAVRNSNPIILFNRQRYSIFLMATCRVVSSRL
jgi:hypothetical protein